MKSKVILFCVLLFCSKIVDSNPHSEDSIRQRVNSPLSWKVNQNAQNGQYLDTDLNIQQEKTQDYNTNQGRYNYDNNGYNRSPASLATGRELLVSYDSSANRRRLDSSQVGFDNQQYRNQNWRSQNQYTNSDPSSGLIPDDQRPLLPVQYLQPKYVSASKRRFDQPGFFNQYQHLTGDKKYIENSAPLFGSSGSIPYDTYSEDQVSESQRKARPSGGRRFLQSIVPQPGIIYNKAPADNIEYAENYRLRSDLSNTAPITNYDDGSPVKSAADNYSLDSKPSIDPVPYESNRESQAAESEVKSRTIGDRNYVHRSAPQFERIYHKALAVGATDTLKDQPENIKYFENHKSRLSNTAPITNHDDSSLLISEADNSNSDSIPTNFANVNSKKEAPVEISKNLSERPLARIYENNYRPDSGWNKVARDDSFNGVTETVAVKSGKYESDYGLKEPVPINTYSGASSAPTDTELLNSRNNKYEESKVAHHGSSNPTINTNPKQNPKLISGIEEHNLRRLASNPEIHNISKENKRYVVVHSNGTVEYLNRRDIDSHQYSKLRLVNTKRKTIDGSDGDGVLTQKSPDNLPNNIVKTSPPVDKYPLPTNNQPADVKKQTPLHVDQANPAYDSNMSPPLKDLPGDHSDLKALPQPEKQSADNNNSKPLPSYVIPSAGDDNSKSLTPNDDQSEQNDNLKPLPQDVPRSGDDYDSKPLTPHVNQSAADGNSKPLPQDGNQPADDDKSKQLIQNKDQPVDDDLYSERDQPKDKNNFTPLFPNTRQPSHVKKPKHSYLKHPENDFQDHSMPLPTNENQPDHDRPFHPYRKHHHKSRYSHVNKPGEDNNSNLSTTPKLLTYPENQQEDDNDFKSLPAHTTQSANDTKSHGDQGGDDNNLTPAPSHENQPEEDKKSKPLRRNENQLTDDIKSEPTPAVASNNDDQSNSTTISAIVPNYTTSTKPQVIKTHKHNHIHRKSTTDSPVVSTTPCSDDTLEDQIITLSPIEKATDNVSDVPPVATTTTTTRPVKSSGISDIINDANNKQDDVQDDTAQTYSTTTATPSSSASPTNIISDDKTIGTKKNKNTQTNDKTVVDQDNGEKDTHTAVYNSSELFDTNTDVPAESDDYSSVTASPSVQNDVNTGDASGDNALELGYSETGVTITVSSDTATDSEDEIIAINIEVTESTDDADSSSSDKSLVVSIDTNDGSDDDSKTPKPEDWKKDHSSNDGRGNNVEIDMSNLKGEPTMWIRTTNQDFIDKLSAKNDTDFDLIYFFHIENLPAIEREKATTIYCNGTVVTETTEITYAHKDDPTPTIIRTTKTTQNEDYEAK